MRKKWILIVPLAILGIVLFVFLGGEVVMRLWNWLVPSIAGLRAITFWEALGTLALCRILFGGFGGRGSGGPSIRRRVGERLADRIGVRWDAMTPEERERFRQRMRERCGFDPLGGEGKGA